jgi:hypothetical protein
VGFTKIPNDGVLIFQTVMRPVLGMPCGIYLAAILPNAQGEMMQNY